MAEEKKEGEKPEEKSEKEKRVRAITKLYYSNPAILDTLVNFAKDRECVPRYFEGFGKRPDMIQYPSDVIGLVNKGATSLHCSEELWNDPLAINNEMDKEKFDEIRKGWDLLIDIDSPYLDFSTIAAKLLLDELEFYGIRNYGIKFSGSKGWHIIVGWKAFPEKFEGRETKEMFPEWPRAICAYLMEKIKYKFSKQTHNISDMSALEIRTNKKAEELTTIVCPQCGKPVEKDTWMTLKCEHCFNEIRQKKSAIARKRVLRCGNCLSIMNIQKEEEFYECKECKISNISKIGNDESKNVKYDREAVGDVADMDKSLHQEFTGGFDLVLVAPRHLFRMPYSMHEKTSLASIVITKEQLSKFVPRDANPLTARPINFYPENDPGEASKLLKYALEWKKKKDLEREEEDKKYYKNYSGENSDDSKNREYEEIDPKDIREEMYPESIKKILKGLRDGRKRGLFVLITFFRCLNYLPEEINNKIKEWNKTNPVPLKDGYVKSQIDWHLKQKRKILPPNYENEAFYKDLGVIDKKPEVKNPLVEMGRNIRKSKYGK